MRNRPARLGFLALVFVVALGGMGAGFASSARDSGTEVSTCTGELECVRVSGTEVWKDLDSGGCIVVPTVDGEPCDPRLVPVNGLRVAWAEARCEDGRASMDWNNIFPCIDFCADVVLRYTGTIPASMVESATTWCTPEAESLFGPYKHCTYWVSTTGIDGPYAETDLDTLQLSSCDHLKIVCCVCIPQCPLFEGVCGCFSTTYTWSQSCDPDHESAWAQEHPFGGGTATWLDYSGVERTVPLAFGKVNVTVVGEVTVSAPVGGFVNITITLDPGWGFSQDGGGMENVHLQDYYDNPSPPGKPVRPPYPANVAPGSFDYHFDVSPYGASPWSTGYVVPQAPYYALHVEVD